MIYVASPYSHPLHRVRLMRFEAARSFIASKLQDGLIVFSPIVYLHDIAEQYYFPKDADYWKTFNFSILKLCEKLWVLQLDGWERSEGISLEIKFCMGYDIPVEFHTWHE